MELFKLLGKIAIDNSDANKSIDDTKEKAGGFAEKLEKGIITVGKWGAAIAAAAGTAAIAIGTMSVNAAIEYEQNFAKVSTLLTGSEEDMENYKKALLDASTETGIAAAEMSEAVYSAISASVDQDSAIQFAEQAALLARGGFTDTATAVDVLTTAINAYGLSVDDAGKISDMLINTQNLGKTTVDELASSMGKIIPTANSFGVELDDLCGAYAEITKNGIATAEATTYMNSMLNELGKSGTTASETLKEMTGHIKDGGMTFSEMMADGWELTDVLSLLDEAAQSSGKSMADMFGSAEAGKAATVLWNNGADLNELITAMGEAAGTTEEAAAKMANTFETRVGKVKNSLENMKTTLGQALMPYVEKVLLFVEEHMPDIEALFVKLEPVFSTFFDTLLPPLMDLVVSILPILVDIIDALLPIFSDICESVLPIIVDLINLLVPPILQIAQDILPIISTLLEAISPILQPIMDLLSPIIDLLLLLLEPLLELINIILPPYIEYLSLIIEIVSGVLMVVLQAIVSFFNDKISPVIQKALDALGNLKDKMLSWFTTIRDKLSDFKSKVVIIFSSLKTTLKNTFTNIKDSVSETIDKLKEKFKTGFEGMKNAVKTPINGIIKFINKLIDGLNKLNFEIPDWVPGEYGGKEFGINIPKIPLLAKGGTVTGSGSVIVGENAPEILDLPRGATVRPLDGDHTPVGIDYDKLFEVFVRALATLIPYLGITIEGDMNKFFKALQKKASEYNDMTGGYAF